MAYGEDVVLCKSNNAYTSEDDDYDGTSFSAPFVAGAAALLLSYDNTLTTAQLKQYILEGVQTSSNLTNYCSTGGYLDAYGAFLAMLHDKTVSVNLQAQQIKPTAQTGTIAMYNFEVYHQKPYARLTEIVIPEAVKNNMFSVDMDFTGNEINVTLHVDAAHLPKDTPLMEFHFITYYTAIYGKAYVSLSGGTHTNLDGDLVTANVPNAKVIMGDVNNDNAVNATDQLKILQHVSGSSLLTGNAKIAADVDGNFVINAVDSMQVSKYASGKLLSFY